MFFQADIFLVYLAFLDDAVDLVTEFNVVEGFLKIVNGAEFDRFYGGFDGSVSGQKDHLDGGIRFDQLFENFDS